MAVWAGLFLAACLVCAQAGAAATRLSTADARHAAYGIADDASAVGGRFALGGCVRFTAARVDCRLDVSEGRACAVVVSERAMAGRRGHVLTRLYGCPLAQRPSAGQIHAARA